MTFKYHVTEYYSMSSQKGSVKTQQKITTSSQYFDSQNIFLENKRNYIKQNDVINTCPFPSPTIMNTFNTLPPSSIMNTCDYVSYQIVNFLTAFSIKMRPPLFWQKQTKIICNTRNCEHLHIELYKAVVMLDVSLEDLPAGTEDSLKSATVQLDTLELSSGDDGGSTGGGSVTVRSHLYIREENNNFIEKSILQMANQ